MSNTIDNDAIAAKWVELKCRRISFSGAKLINIIMCITIQINLACCLLSDRLLYG